MPNSSSPPPPAIEAFVATPARLHLGFLDPSATLGRPFGSLGLTVDHFSTRLVLRPAADTTRVTHAQSVPASEAERALAHLHTLQRLAGKPAPIHLHLEAALPAHAGLGSGTQLALAVGRAFSTVHGLDLDTRTLASWLGRGRRSAIGIAGFDQGGLLLDGGPSALATTGPLLARLVLPVEWRVLLALDPRHEGLTAKQEAARLATIPPLPRESAADICHRVLMQILPAAADGGFADFAAGVSEIQRILGRHFSLAQGGGQFSSPAVGRLMAFLHENAGAGIGQSSWGPTGFAFFASQRAAEQALAAATEVCPAHLALHIVRPTVSGARVESRCAEPLSAPVSS